MRPLSAQQESARAERLPQVQDPFGHVWAISTQKEELTSEEMGRRAEKAMAQFAPPAPKPRRKAVRKPAAQPAKKAARKLASKAKPKTAKARPKSKTKGKAKARKR